MSKIREKESLECGRMHIWALKTQKLPGSLSGPWTPAANCSLCSRDLASLCQQLLASEPGAAPPWPNPGSAPVKTPPTKWDQILCLHTLLPACHGFLRFISSATLAYLLTTSISTELHIDPHTFSSIGGTWTRDWVCDTVYTLTNWATSAWLTSVYVYLPVWVFLMTRQTWILRSQNEAEDSKWDLKLNDTSGAEWDRESEAHGLCRSAFAWLLVGLKKLIATKKGSSKNSSI